MKKILTILSLILALALCVGAIAETTAAEQPAAQAVAADERALTEALEAYKMLKGSIRVKNMDALKQELESFVAEGKLTQEQADLILKYYTERIASKGKKHSTDDQNNQKQNGCGKQNGQRQQPTNSGEQGQMQRQQRQQRQNVGQQSHQNGSSSEVDTTSGATSKKGQ